MGGCRGVCIASDAAVLWSCDYAGGERREEGEKDI